MFFTFTDSEPWPTPGVWTEEAPPFFPAKWVTNSVDAGAELWAVEVLDVDRTAENLLGHVAHTTKARLDRPMTLWSDTTMRQLAIQYAEHAAVGYTALRPDSALLEDTIELARLLVDKPDLDLTRERNVLRDIVVDLHNQGVTAGTADADRDARKEAKTVANTFEAASKSVMAAYAALHPDVTYALSASGRYGAEAARLADGSSMEERMWQTNLLMQMLGEAPAYDLGDMEE